MLVKKSKVLQNVLQRSGIYWNVAGIKISFEGCPSTIEVVIGRMPPTGSDEAKCISINVGEAVGAAKICQATRCREVGMKREMLDFLEIQRQKTGEPRLVWPEGGNENEGPFRVEHLLENLRNESKGRKM